MFWQVASGSISSAIDGILDQEDFTLEELLVQDDIVQEVKAPNKRLVEYLQKSSTMEQLLRLIVQQAPDDADTRSKYKLPFAACDVLCCESEELSEALVADESLLALLFSITRPQQPLDSLLANYFARVVGTLLTREGPRLLAWLKEHTSVLDDLTEQLGATAMAETLVRLVGADEQMAAYLPVQLLSWVPDTEVLSRLLAMLEGDTEYNVRENAAEVLAAIARARSSPLTRCLGSSVVMRRLIMRAIEAPETQTLVQSLNICIALVERRRLLEAAFSGGVGSTPLEADRMLEVQAVAGVAPHAAYLLQLLADNDTKAQEMPFGILAPPLGSARLTVVALLAVLLRTGVPEAENAVMDTKMLSCCLDLFINYPFNSILHHQVASIIGSTLESGSDELTRHLFADCNLLSWLIEAPTEVLPVPCTHDAKAGKRPALRAGYMGHITQVANKIQAAAIQRDIVAGFLSADEQWLDFASSYLAKANKMEDVTGWECGRPDTTRVAVDSDGDDPLLADDPSSQSPLSLFGPNGHLTSGFEDDSDSDEGSSGGSPGAPQYFDALALSPGDEDDDADFGMALVDNLTLGSPAANPAKLLSRRTRAFNDTNDVYNNPDMDLDDSWAARSPEDASAQEELDMELDSVIEGFFNRSRAGRANTEQDTDTADSAEELETIDLDAEPLGATMRSGLHASASEHWNTAEDLPGPGFMRTEGFGGSSPPLFGESALHGAIRASILTEELKAAAACTGPVGGEGAGPPAVDHAELRQPGEEPDSPAGAMRIGAEQLKASKAGNPEGATHMQPGSFASPPMSPNSLALPGRRSSPERHPATADASQALTHHVTSIQLEPLLQNSEPSPDTPRPGRRPTSGGSEAQSIPAKAGVKGEEQEQTLVGSFTKLDLSPDSMSEQPKNAVAATSDTAAHQPGKQRSSQQN